MNKKKRPETVTSPAPDKREKRRGINNEVCIAKNLFEKRHFSGYDSRICFKRIYVNPTWKRTRFPFDII